MNKVRVLAWRKSLRSIGSGDCVEIAPAAGDVVVRDSKDPSGPVLAYNGVSWRTFTLEVRQGYFDAFKQ